MSSDEIVLSVKNISKRFEMYDKPRHRLQQMFFGRFGKQYFKEFWALRDISFDIRKGECVGVIGRNGAGKSTLLQILVGILQPTTGSVKLKGRVAALLELGSGFNPEFTGRENVYMNASILGLSREEIDHKFQDILDFSEIGDFIEHPVKSYSSGMMVRLAFAVQIMVDPDILIIDEALAVGDAAFQRKCFARMEQLVKKGTTLFLVTHDTDTVKQLCSRSLFLNDKRCVFDGPAAEGVGLYLQYLFPPGKETGYGRKPWQDSRGGDASQDSEVGGPCYTWTPEQKDAKNSFGYGGGYISAIRVYGLREPNILPESGQVTIELDGKWNQVVISNLLEQEDLQKNVFLGFGLSNEKNIRIFGENTYSRGVLIDPMEQDQVTAVFCVDFPTLKSGQYFLDVALSLGRINASVKLDWNNYALCLISDNQIRGGFLLTKTKISLKKM